MVAAPDMSRKNTGNKSPRLRLLLSSTAVLVGLFGAGVPASATDVDVLGATVDGRVGGPYGTNWTVPGDLNIGSASAGSLTIINGGQVSSETGVIGVNRAGTMTVSGRGSTWRNDIDINVGRNSDGVLTISDGALVESAAAYIGDGSTSTGNVLITGSGSTWRNSGDVYLSLLGTATLTVSDGATFESATAYLVYDTSSTSSSDVLITGSGSSWTNSGAVYLGLVGTSTLTLSDGATLSAGNMSIANNFGSSGTLYIGSSTIGSPGAAGTFDVDSVTFGDGSGVIVFNHDDENYVFASDVARDGFLDFVAGSTSLTGSYRNFTGAMRVSGGYLSVDTVTSASIDVIAGAIGGSGTIGGLSVGSGATLAPGNSIGTLTVAGNASLLSGSAYQVEVTDAGTADLLHATGTVTIDSGARLNILAENRTDDGSTYSPATTYTIITADDGLSGQFGTVTENFAYLDASMAYSSTNALLTLTRAADFVDHASTPNQKATAEAIDAMGSGTLYNAILGLPTGSTEAAFDSLSGTIHPSIQGVMVETSRLTREALNDRLRAASNGVGAPSGAVAAFAEGGPELSRADAEPFAFWGSGFGSWGRYVGGSNDLGIDSASGGALFGADASVGDYTRLGLAAGYSSQSVTENGIDSDATIDSYHLAAYGGSALGPLALRFGGVYSWNDISSDRSVRFSGFTDALSADYDARTAQAFVEAAWRMDYDLLHLEPFANLAYVNQQTDAFTEEGGAAALSSDADTFDTLYSTIGARVDRDFAVNGVLGKIKASASWRHAYGDVESRSTMSFAGGDGFTICGVPLARDTALVGLDVAFEVGERSVLTLGYTGQFADGVSEQGVRGDLKVKF